MKIASKALSTAERTRKLAIVKQMMAEIRKYNATMAAKTPQPEVGADASLEDWVAARAHKSHQHQKRVCAVCLLLAIVLVAGWTAVCYH